MAQRLNWSPEAIEDLNSIRDYIVRDSLFYARSVVRRVLATAKQIPDATGIGRIVPEIDDEKSENGLYTVIDLFTKLRMHKSQLLQLFMVNDCWKTSLNVLTD